MQDLQQKLKQQKLKNNKFLNGKFLISRFSYFTFLSIIYIKSWFFYTKFSIFLQKLHCLHKYAIIKNEGGILLKEYGIYIRQGSGTPYMIHIFDNLDNAKIKLYDMISLDEERLNPYFVDNDFFENRYDI